MAHGWISGCVATLAMSLMMGVAGSLAPAFDLVGALARLAGDLGLPGYRAMGWVLHMAAGTFLWGTTFAAIRPNLPQRSIAAGLVFGGLAWIALILVFLPLAGQPALTGFALGWSLACHLVFGIVLAGTFDRMNKSAASRVSRPSQS